MTQEEVEQYRRDGFIVLHEFWTPAELDEWREATEEAVSERPLDWKFPRQNQEDVTNVDRDYYDNVFIQRINLWATNQRMKDTWLKFGRDVGRIAAALEGVPGYRIWHDQALIKVPFCGAAHCLTLVGP